MTQCTSRNGDIHFCKLEEGHKGNHYCSHMCDDWERQKSGLMSTYTVTVRVEAPDGSSREKVQFCTHRQVVAWLIEHTARQLADYVEVVDPQWGVDKG